MLRPVCVKDQREYKVQECGVALVEYFKSDGELKPYKFYFADLWMCPVCGHQILGGYGEPEARGHEKEKMQELIATWTELGKLYWSCEHEASCGTGPPCSGDTSCLLGSGAKVTSAG